MLTDVLTWWSSLMNEVAGGNDFLAGTLSVSIVGVLAYLGRGIPRSIFEFLKRHFTTTMTMNNGGYDEAIVMYNFYEWLDRHLSESLSRTLSVTVDNSRMVGSDSVSVGIGYGIHFFFLDGRFYWVHKSKLDSSGSERQKEEVAIGTISRSHEPLRRLVEMFKPKDREQDVNRLYKPDTHGDWDMVRKVPKRPIESVALPMEMKDQFISDIEHFKTNREWFYNRALPYKMTYILHGIPGTGKTSFIKSVASHFDMNLCTINLNSMYDDKLESVMSTVPDNSVILIEDFDSSPMTRDRSTTVVDDGKMSLMTLSGFLNVLDGAAPLDNCIIFMTTNHLENVDPAIYRPGRVDRIVEFGVLDDETVRGYINYLYPDFDLSRYQFESVIGCWMNEALLVAKDDPEKFIGMLKERECVIDDGP